MAKKPKARALGNDPFLRGAAIRPDAADANGRKEAGGSAHAPGPLAAQPEAMAAAFASATRGGRHRAAESGASEAAGATGTPAEAPGAAERPSGATRRTARQRRTEAGRRGAKRAGTPPSASPGAVESAAARAEAETVERTGAMDEATAIDEAAAAMAADAGLAPGDLAGPAPEPAAGEAPEPEAIAGDAGLLPADLSAIPTEPAVVAVPTVPPPPSPAERDAPPLARQQPPSASEALAAAWVALRQILGLPATAPSFDVDELGYDPALAEQVRPLLDWAFDRWFRVEVHGIERLPQEGPAILVANRAGAVPWDSAMLSVACRRAGRTIRPLVEDDVFHFPAFGVLINRLGAVRACPENAERILGAGGAIAVFPEGATGFGKPFRERYRLQRFGRGGFARIALRTGAPVVPVAIVGSEEIHPLLARVPARSLGLPFIPITPTFPWLGLAGLLPLPSRWHIDVGEPIALGHDPEAARDASLVLRHAEHVRATIQAMLDERLAKRRSVFR